jgi:hypothetical protein
MCALTLLRVLHFHWLQIFSVDMVPYDETTYRLASGGGDNTVKVSGALPPACTRSSWPAVGSLLSALSSGGQK